MKLKQAFISQIFVAFTPILFHVYILKIYNTDEAGNIFVILSCITFLTMIISAGQQKGFYAEHVLSNSEFNVSFCVMYVLFAIVIFTFFSALLFLDVISFLTIYEALLVVTTATFYTCLNYVSLIHQKWERLLLSTFIGISGPYTFAIIAHLTVTTTLHVDWSVAITYSFTIFTFFIISLILLIVKYGYQLSLDFAIVRCYYRHCIPYASVSVLTSAFTTVPVILCSVIFGPSVVAMFVYATKVVNVVSMPLVAVNRLSIVKYTNEKRPISSSWGLSRAFHKITLVISLPLIAALLTLSELVITWGDIQFSGYGYVLQVLIAKHFINILTGQTTVLLFSANRANVVFRNQFVAFLLLIILSIICFYYRNLYLMLAIFITPSIFNNLFNFFYLNKLRRL
jgi:O-antigen/teichoic acid export membrane protein